MTTHTQEGPNTVNDDTATLGCIPDDLPVGVHATILTGRDVVTGGDLAYPVVWADRPYNTCPRCHQPVVQDLTERCPVMLNTGAGQGGEIQQVSQQHGCGEWLQVDWIRISPAEPGCEVTPGSVRRAAQVIALARVNEIDNLRAATRAALRFDLRAAVARLAVPLGPGETQEDREDLVVTGGETDPGVCREDDGTLSAWDYDPAGDSEPIIVHEADLGTVHP